MGRTGLVWLDFDRGASQAAYDRLCGDVDSGISTRLPWLGAWRDTHRTWRPWLLALQDQDGRLTAAAPLAFRRRRGISEVTALGAGDVDDCPVLYREPEAGRDLAAGVGDALRWVSRPWRLALFQLPRDCAFGAELVRRLDCARRVAGSGQPIVSVEGVRAPKDVISLNLRKAENRARNRILRDGLELEETWVREPRGIVARLPEVARVHRDRDVQLRGTSLLDDSVERLFWDALVRRHLPRAELLELSLDGDLAAFVLWVRLGSLRHVLDNRVSPRWTAYSAGLIANNVALRKAAADPDVEVLDWGAGVQRYKLQSAQTVIPHDNLVAWSSATVRRLLALRDELWRQAQRQSRHAIGAHRSD
jgi:hypothetical protein